MFPPIPDETAFLYQSPMDLRGGEKRLTEFCIDELQMDPRQGGIFVFFNGRRDQLKIIFFSKQCYHEIVKWVPSGSVSLPAARGTKRVSVLKREKLDEILGLSSA
jgi:IS66 Orf2 like protein